MASILAIYTLALIEGRAQSLSFERANIRVEGPIDQVVFAESFVFRNVSPNSIVIADVRTECDCVTTSIAPDSIAPGESGQIGLQFRARTRNGIEVTKADVVTDSGEIYHISLTAAVRSYIHAVPNALIWKKGEKRVPKKFRIQSSGLAELRFLKVAAVGAVQIDVTPKAFENSMCALVTPPAVSGPFREIVLVSVILSKNGETRLYDLEARGE